MCSCQTLLPAILLVSSLALAPPATAGKRDNTLKIAFEQVPESIDAYFNNIRPGIILAHHVWDHLVYRDPKTSVYKPSLATAWRQLDETTLEFDLRRGVVFHNGEAFDADDVVYTLNYMAKPENRAVSQQNISWIAGVDKLDQYKIRIRMKKPFPAAIEYLAGPLVIYPNEYYARVGPKGMNEKPIGTGPYMVTEHQPGRLIRLKRNPDYFKDSPKPRATIENLDIRLIPDRNTQNAELMAGGLDWIYNVEPDMARQFKSVPSLAVASGETMRIAFLQMATDEKSPSPMFKDIRVRKAINHAIDRSAMLKTVVSENARTLSTICFPSQFGCTDEDAPRYAYDPARAKALLAEAGFPNGFDIDFYAYRDRQQVEAIIGYLRAVGIRANLRFMQFVAYRDAMRDHKGGFGVATWGSFSVNDTSASTPVYFKFEPDDINRDREVRDLLDAGDTSVKPAVRQAAYKNALKKIAEQAYTAPLYSLPVNYGFSKDLVFQPYPDEIPRFWEARWK